MDECHVAVDFHIPGIPIQHYRATPAAAAAFVSQAGYRGRPHITIDDVVSVDYPPMPYQRLFLEQPPHQPHLHGNHTHSRASGVSIMNGEKATQADVHLTDPEQLVPCFERVLDELDALADQLRCLTRLSADHPER